MKLWLLEPLVDRSVKGNPWYGMFDVFYGHVVRAETEEEARNMVPAGDEKNIAWTDPKYSTCIPITEEGKPGVILSNFHAG